MKLLGINCYLFCWDCEQSSQNNQCSWWCSPLGMSEFFPKTVFHEGKNFFRQKIFGEVVLNSRLNDQIMPRCERSFINDKCIFQQSMNTVNLHLKIKSWCLYKIRKVFTPKVLTVKRSQKLCHFQFPLCWLWLGILIYYLKC